MSKHRFDESSVPKRVVGYIRVSSKKQERDGISLLIQWNKLIAYCDVMGLDLIDIRVDAKTAKNMKNRPGLDEAFAVIRSGAADAIIVTKLDRLTRSVRDLADMTELYFSERPTIHKCELISTSDSIDTRTASGRLVLNVLCSVAQWEREVIVERTCEAMDELKEQGVRLGPARLEGPAIERIRALKAQGCSLRKIASVLSCEGHETKHKKGPWRAESVRKILARERVAA